MGMNGSNEQEGAEGLPGIPDAAAGVSDYAKDRDELVELRARLAEGEDKHLRLLADFQNYRNRSAKEVQMEVEKAEKQILTETLQVMDSFRRCLDSSYGSIEDFRSGVGLIEKQFDAALRRLGVSEIEMKTGDAFDAHVADALVAVKTPDFPPGSIVEVHERGYMVGERLLRPARVVVAADEEAT
jgi:molecular chaperone GrpE